MPLVKQHIILYGLVFLAGCSTGYQKKSIIPLFGMDTGFSEKKISVDTWQVKFSGNQYTKKDYVDAAAFYRAAEIMKQNNFSYFQVLKGDGLNKKISYSPYGGGPTNSFFKLSILVRGANSKSDPLDCQNPPPIKCMTLETSVVLGELESYVRK